MGKLQAPRRLAVQYLLDILGHAICMDRDDGATVAQFDG